MKPRNFEASPLTEAEFGIMLIGVDDNLLINYLRWIVEDLNRRGLTISRGLAEQLAGMADDNTNATWQLPVGNAQYPSHMWYAATFHDVTGKRNNGYKHTGLDLNLDVSPWGDVDRGQPVYAITDGIVSYITQNWSGVPMVVINHGNIYARYAHIAPAVFNGDRVHTGQVVGYIANWATGDHLHFDMARSEFTREWLSSNIEWIDPEVFLKTVIDSKQVESMLNKGD